jgi:hypothetical protein
MGPASIRRGKKHDPDRRRRLSRGAWLIGYLEDLDLISPGNAGKDELAV